jgi:CubicO group peptidase (beta-lactamase class C family)
MPAASPQIVHTLAACVRRASLLLTLVLTSGAPATAQVPAGPAITTFAPSPRPGGDSDATGPSALATSTQNVGAFSPSLWSTIGGHMTSLRDRLFTMDAFGPLMRGTTRRLARAPATSMGMNSDKLAVIDRLVGRGIAAGGFSGAAVVVGRGGVTVREKGFGHIQWDATSNAVDPDSTIYDLASLTKVVATTSAIMVLYDEGRVHLTDRVVSYVPQFHGGAKDFVTVEDLLLHRSGLPAGRDLTHAPSVDSARALVATTALRCAPRSCYIYSDLNADLLGFIVEAASGMRLDRFVARHVFDPLGMTDTQFRPDSARWARLAPTGAPLGQVHDTDARALGGVAGHAGLFSTAADLAVFAQMLLNGGTYDSVRVISDSTVRRFTTRAAIGTRALGWDTCDRTAPGSTCGRLLSERTFGHTGFTGTSLWIDPDHNMFVVLLTNRVHSAKVSHPALVIHDIRADLADAAALTITTAPTSPWAALPFRADLERGWTDPVHKPTKRHTLARGRKTGHHAARHRVHGH